MSQTLTDMAPPAQQAVAADPGSTERLELLLGRCARRDEPALRELYELVAPQLFGILLRILRRRALAEEALQDVIVKIWQRADQYMAYRGRAMAWMAAIARYRAIDLLRIQHSNAPLEEVPEEMLADISSAEFLDTTSTERLRRALSDCLGLLSNEQRRCLTLAYMDGYSHDQIANTVASPLGTVKSWMRRGLASLKRCLDS